MWRLSLALFVALIALPVLATTKSDLVACDSKLPDIRINGCSALIRAGYGNDAGEKAPPYSNRADGYLARGEIDLAIADYERAIRLWPTYWYYWVKLGLAEDKAGRRAEAIDSFTRASVFYPTSVEAFVNRGVDYDLAGNHDLALADFERAIQLDSKDPEAFNDRGYTLLGMGRLDEAINDLTTAINLNPNYVVAHNNRAWALHLKNQDAAGLSDAEAAFRLGPNLPDSSWIRAAIYEGLDRRADAVKAYQNALKIDPNNAFSKAALHRLTEAH